MTNSSLRLKTLDLLLAGVLVILFELITIRWVGSNIKVAAYFGNIILIACFLGIGWGYLAGNTFVDLKSSFPVAVLLFILAIYYLKQYSLISVDPSHHFHLDLAKDPAVGKNIHFFALIVSCFVVTTLLFVPLGQIVGRLFASSGAPLAHYAVNIAGNGIGALGFILLSFLWTPPIVWFATGFVLYLWFLRHSRAALLIGLAAFALSLLLLRSGPSKGVEYWSPYYHVSLSPITASPHAEPIGYVVNADGQRHQDCLDFDSALLPQTAYGWWSDFYRIPYRFKTPEKILILGAGTGNDTWFALQNGAGEIHAVEIEPAFIAIGNRHHPQRPYARDRVTVINDDARAFLADSRETYDMIVFGVLDSHRLASYMSLGLRLDDYLYTVECFELVRHRLKPDGVLVLQNGGPPWMVARIYNGLKQAFGKAPDLYQLRQEYAWGILNYVISPTGPNPAPASGQDLFQYGNADEALSPYGLLTDDRPFLYLKNPGIPKPYLQVGAFILLFAACGVASTWLFKKSVFRHVPAAASAHFFLMGMAFLLIETVGISRSAVLLGCTWLTTSSVATAVFVYILLANWIAAKHNRVPLPGYYLLLAASLLICYFFPMASIAGHAQWVRLLLAAFVLGLPVLFSSIIFAVTFKSQKNSELILGVNLLGAVAGGLLQHLDLVTGMRFLYLVAILLYAGSFIMVLMQRPTVAGEPT